MLFYEGWEGECCFMRDGKRNVVGWEGECFGMGGGMLWNGRGNVVPIFRFFD